MAMAATWAGYHISRHLINRNIYDMSEEEVQRQKTQLDTLVWLGCLQVPHLRALFEGVLRENGDMDMDKPVESLQQEMYLMQWDRFVGACHRVGYNWERSLPLPLCKPSRLLREMRASRELPDDWDHETAFTEEFDEPLDPSLHTFKAAYPMVLAQNVTAKVERINAWLLAFLRRQALRDDVTSAEFSYMPPEAFPDEDDRRPAEPPSAIVKMEIPLEQIQMDISLLKTSVARVEVAVAESRERHAETLGKITELYEKVTEIHEKAARDAAEPPSHNLSDIDLDALARRVAPALLGILQPDLTKTVEASLEVNMEQTREAVHSIVSDAAKSIMSDAATSIMDSNNARAAEVEKSMEQHYSQSTARMAELKKSVEKHCSHQTARTAELKKSMDQHYAQNTARTVELKTSMEEHFSHHTARTTELKTSMDHHYSQNTVRSAELKKSMEQHCSQALRQTKVQPPRPAAALNSQTEQAPRPPRPATAVNDTVARPSQVSAQISQSAPPLDRVETRAAQNKAQPPRSAPTLDRVETRSSQSKAQVDNAKRPSQTEQPGPAPTLDKTETRSSQTGAQPPQPAPATRNTKHRHSDAGPVTIDLESPAPYFTRSKKDRFPAGRHSDAGAVLIDLEAPAPYYTRSKKDLFAAGRHSDVGPVVIDFEHAAPYYTRSKRDRASSGRLSEGTRVHRDDDDEALSTSTPPLIKRSKLFSGGAVPENPLAQPTKTPQQLKQEYMDTYWRDQAATESESVSVKRPPSEEPSFEQAQKRQKSVRFGV
ncbi:hypothetical protein B0T11DRAFT_288709 [Plectosphaerella cucumerina]|uniref:Uncharacterized protein n=1 Tax=Plectosphaerella cucumerina TaxID=40658 RepID=A0A8K0X2C1_9PEZI|nr:hypothetical protein B0T11DRAFT_288709 [Plectosphaerella cucumerina]